MDTYPVDIDPELLVQWALMEHSAAPSALRFAARCGRETRDVPFRGEFRFGDEEREDLNEVATVATLDIAPAHAGEGWTLTVVVEDEIGPRERDEDTSFESEREIDLRSFYDEFIRAARGVPMVIANVESSAARARVARLISMIEKQRPSLAP